MFKGWLLLVLPPHCLRITTPCVFTLSHYFGTLTAVGVIPLSAVALNSTAQLPSSSTELASEFDKEARAFAPILPNQCLYLTLVSNEAELRFTSKETRYRQARMNFHPYTWVTQADRLALVAGYPPSGRTASPCPRIDRFGFRSQDSDLRPITTARLASPFGLLRRFCFRCA